MYYVIKIYGTKDSLKKDIIVGVCILNKHPKNKERLIANGIYYDLETKTYYNVFHNTLDKTNNNNIYKNIIECLARNEIMKKISKYSLNKFINTINELETKIKE